MQKNQLMKQHITYHQKHDMNDSHGSFGQDFPIYS